MNFLATNQNWGMSLYASLAMLAVKTIPKIQTLGCLGF